MAIDLEKLGIFLAVAEHRSFTRAAEAMYISHSTTSRNVAALEEELGVLLLTRDNRVVRLTPAGEVLYREGVRLMRRIEGIEDMVRGAGQDFGRRLTVAIAPMEPEGLSEKLRDFCAARREVRVSLLRREPGEIWKLVDSGEADLGLTTGSALPENPGDLERMSYAWCGLRLFLPPGDGLANADVVPHGLIAGRELVCESAAGRFITPELRMHNTVTLMPTVDSVFLRVSTGGAVAILPEFFRPGPGADCVSVPLSSPAREEAALIWRGSNQNPSLEALLRLLGNGAAEREKEGIKI